MNPPDPTSANTKEPKLGRHIRRSHPKSRHGCATCKRRRVKCDETRPVCINCSHRKEKCVYNESGPFTFAENPPPRSKRAVQASTQEQASGVSDTQEFNFESWSPVSDLADNAPSLNMKQIELVLQWMKHTHRVFARNEEVRPIWETTVLQEALSSPLLMHGILAISALHLSHLCEEGQRVPWLDLAIAHKNTALTMFTQQLHAISQSNAKAMMIFAGLAFAFSLASALNMDTAEDRPGLATLTDVFTLARGVQTVINAEAHFLSQSNLAPLFKMEPLGVTLPDHALAVLDALDQLNIRCQPHSGHNIASYARAIEGLRDFGTFTYSAAPSMTMAAGWAIRAPADYFNDLKAKKPFALVVLAHYCVFLHMCRENWCIGPWGLKVLEDILHTLEPDWQAYISWPVEEVLGADPHYDRRSSAS